MPKNRSKTVQSNDDYVDLLDFVANEEKDICELLMEQVSFKNLPKETKAQLNYLVLNLDGTGYLSFDKAELREQLDIDEFALKELIFKI